MKKAVIASDIPGNAEIIKNDMNGFTINVQNYEEFSNKILLLIKNQELREKLQNHNDIFTKWDADFMIKKQEELYKELLIKQK
jgi:glycosyltransferase involved in cell wall biosynthesis